MQSTLKLKTKVLPGHRIEISSPQLKEGQTVEVSIAPASLDDHSPTREESADSWIRRYREWVDTHKDWPSLRPEAYHRAYYYEDDL
jgi:hypothetical protein